MTQHPIDSDWFDSLLEWVAFVMAFLLTAAVVAGLIALVVLVIVG